MLKEFKTLLWVTAFFVAAQSASAMSLALEPKGDKMLSNDSLWTIHATCQIHGGSSKKTIKIQGVKNTAQVNGKELTAGKTTSMTVYDEKTVEVTAEPGAQVTIINLSNESVEAVCST